MNIIECYFEIEESWKSETGEIQRKNLPLTFYDRDSAIYVSTKLRNDPQSMKTLLGYLNSNHSEFFVVKKRIKF